MHGLLELLLHPLRTQPAEVRGGCLDGRPGAWLDVKMEPRGKPDGAQRAQHCAVVQVLQQLGVLQGGLPKRLADWMVRPIKNTRGEIVGEVRPAA